MTTPLEGKAENGKRAELAIASIYTGTAGARDLGENRLELAYFGSAPRRLEGDVRGTFDSKAIRVVEIQEARNRGMVVLVAELVD